MNEAFVLFGKHAYDGMSMKILAEKSGITKAALYWHYESKDDLFLECVKKCIALVEDHIHSPLRTNLPPIVRLATLCAGVRALMTHPAVKAGITGYWLKPSAVDVEGVWDVVRGFRKRSFTLIEKTLVEGQQQGQFVFDIPPETLARTIHYTIESNMLPLIFFANELAVREHVALVMDTFMRAWSPSHTGFSAGGGDLHELLDAAWENHAKLNPQPSFVTKNAAQAETLT